jgi:hypothetical protein
VFELFAPNSFYSSVLDGVVGFATVGVSSLLNRRERLVCLFVELVEGTTFSSGQSENRKRDLKEPPAYSKLQWLHRVIERSPIYFLFGSA